MSKPRVLCQDCGVCTFDIDEWYMVEDSVWPFARSESPTGFLCIGCLESRIGRKLVPIDFIDAPVNTDKDWAVWSARLSNRLGLDVMI